MFQVFKKHVVIVFLLKICFFRKLYLFFHFVKNYFLFQRTIFCVLDNYILFPRSIKCFLEQFPRRPSFDRFLEDCFLLISKFKRSQVNFFQEHVQFGNLSMMIFLVLFVDWSRIVQCETQLASKWFWVFGLYLRHFKLTIYNKAYNFGRECELTLKLDD